MDPEILRNLSNMVKEFRGDRTQTEYANDIGIGQSQVSNWELERNLPHLKTIENMAKDQGLLPEQVVARIYGRTLNKDDVFDLTEHPLEELQKQPVRVRLEAAAQLIASANRDMASLPADYEQCS